MRIIKLRRGETRTGFLYCGRPFGEFEGSPLGNPYVKGKKCSRCGKVHSEGGDTLPCYRAWLWEKIKDGDEAALRALREVREHSTLACWCVELSGDAVYADEQVCHTQVIARAARWLREKGDD